MASNNTLNQFELSNVESEYDYADLNSVKKTIDDDFFYDDVAPVSSVTSTQPVAINEPAKKTSECNYAIQVVSK